MLGLFISSFCSMQSELSAENLERTNRNLEHRLSLVQAELAAAQTALATTQKDYDSYKVSHVSVTECMSVTECTHMHVHVCRSVSTVS